jgi:steroid delta-isomerase-like uncharacterized protein
MTREAGMSSNPTRQVIDSYLEALLSRGDFAAFFAEDVRWTTMETGEELRGREQVRDFIAVLHTQIFDARPEVRSILAADGAACLEADFVGTHTAEFAGIPATGAKVRVPYCVVYDVEGDQITALRGYLPLGVLVGQLQADAKG